MPLPRRRSGEWVQRNASHRRLENYFLSSSEKATLTLYQQFLRDEVTRLGIAFPVGETNGGFREFMRDISQVRAIVEPEGDVEGKLAGRFAETYKNQLPKEASEMTNWQGYLARTLTDEPLLLIRFFDLVSDSGHAYQYRVRIKIRNPLFGIAEDQLEQQELAHVPSLFTPWSDPTPPVFVPEPFRYYPLEGQAEDSGRFAIYSEIEDAGTPVFTDKLAVPIGTRIGGKVTVDVVDLGKDTLEARDIEFETGDFLAAVTPAPAVSKSAAPLLKDFFNGGGSFPSRYTVIDSNGAVIVRYSGDNIRVDGEKSATAASDAGFIAGLLELYRDWRVKKDGSVTQENVPSNRNFWNNWAGGMDGGHPWAKWKAAFQRSSKASTGPEITEAGLLEETIGNSVGMTLKFVPAGEFMMGSPDDDADRHPDEVPRHKIRITKPFYIGVTEVTQKQWFTVMGTKPWEGLEYVMESDACAATYVSWDDAVDYCRRLSVLDGKQYRLPTEAEWEYACRGGNSTAHSFGSDANELKNYAWFRENAEDIGEMHARDVGGKRANPFGLYDMHGNVWEWCSDWFGPYTANSTVDPVGPSTGLNRVFRGGGWRHSSKFCRSAFRGNVEPSICYSDLGFRVVMSSPAE